MTVAAKKKKMSAPMALVELHKLLALAQGTAAMLYASTPDGTFFEALLGSAYYSILAARNATEAVWALHDTEPLNDVRLATATRNYLWYRSCPPPRKTRKKGGKK